MSVTLRDVAAHAGVSIKTVSRVVNNQSEVSAATRHRVAQVIEELGYRPNVLARGLVSQRSQTIAIVGWTLDQYPSSRFLMGVERETDELGYSLLLTLWRPSRSNHVEEVLSHLVGRQVDGIIWQPPKVGNNQDWITPDRLAALPPMVINSLPHEYVTTVSIDNYHGAVVAVQHLLDQGWQRIGLITAPTEYAMASERHRGWRDCLLQNGQDPDPSLMENGEWGADSGAAALEALLERRPDVDAVFASNDALALGAMRRAVQLGRRIGCDLGVVGYENFPESGYFHPPLSTIHQRIFELGREAVRALVRLIEVKAKGEPLPPPVLILSRPELVVRQSSLRVDYP